MDDVKEGLAYYLLAEKFGWKKSEVDAMPAEHIDTMLTFIEEIGKVSNDAGRLNRR